MAPRMYGNDSRRESPRFSKPSHSSSHVHPRLAQSTRRLARIGTTTQLEGLAPNVSPRPRQSPTSRGNIRLLGAAGKDNSRDELGRLRSVIQRLEDGQMNHNRFIPPDCDSAEVLDLPELDGDSSPEEVENMIEHIIDYLMKWTDEKLIEGSPTVFQDMRLIHASLQNIIELPEEVISSPMVRIALRTFRNRYETFVSVWSQAIHRALVARLSQIESQVKRHPTTFPESRFTSFVSEIRTVSSSYALLVLLDSAHDNISLLVSEDAAKELLDRCSRLHEVFQNATYNSEQKELWLLIWRGLKTAFTAFEQGGAPTSPTNIERDRKFFEIPGVYREFKRLTSSPDAANPRSIEDMVGKYCRYIHKCQIDPGNKYESLQRPQDAPLENHTKEALREFTQTGKFETSTLSKIHFAVARFNKISGGPVKVRRWQHGVENREWEIVAPDLPSPASTYIAERRSSYLNIPSSARSLSSSVNFDSSEYLESAGQRPSKRLFPYPEGVNMKSAFDYVYYPFPETRAHEVVQHEQISREMGQPGIFSEGPRAEYLINRPPRHARDPPDLSVSKRMLSPFAWIRLAIQRVLPQRRRAPDAKHPKVSDLSSRRLQKPSILKPRPLPIDRNSRVHKAAATTPDLKLRGGGPQPSRPGASFNRKHHFDPLAFRRMMMEMLRRELKSKYGCNICLDEDEMLCLLKQTTYDVEKAVQLYQVSGENKNTGPAKNTVKKPRRNLRAGRMASNQAAGKISQRQQRFREIPVGNDAEIYAYRVDPLARPVSWPSEAISPIDNGSDDDRNPGPQQPLPRPPLGDLPVDADVYGEGEGEHNTQHSSNQENHTPWPPRPPHSPLTPEPILSHCHPCPMFEGQYHHVCRCTHVEYPGPMSPDDFHENQSPTGRPNQGSSPHSADHGSEDRADGGNDAHIDRAADGPPCPTPRRNGRPPREEPRPDDDRYVREIFARDPGFGKVLKDIGEVGILKAILDAILGQSGDWLTQPISRDTILSTVDSLAVEILELRDQYAELLEEGPHPFMEQIPVSESRAPNPDAPATIQACRRAALELKHHHARLLQFFDYGHSRTNLGFRHQLNRLIRAVRELRLLVVEYDREHPVGSVGGTQQQQGEGSRTIEQRASPEESSDDTHSDSETTLSTLETARLANRRTPPKRYKIVPTREEYDLMFVDELERELRNRGFANLEQLLGKRYKKADLIDKLMALDKEGNHLGRGATEGYRHITGDLKSRGRPKGFNLEDALKQYYLNCRNERILAKRARREARKQARIDRGIHSPAPVMPRAQPSQLPFHQAAQKTMAGSPKILYQDSEESDTQSVDFRRQ